MNETVSVPDSLADIVAWESKALAHIATIGPDGGPHSSPVWFDWVSNELKVSLYDGSQKMKNVKRDPRVSVSIVDPADAYRYVEIRGVVVSFERDIGLEFITRMAGKYLGLDHYPWHEEGQVEVTVTIKPTRITGMSSQPTPAAHVCRYGRVSVGAVRCCSTGGRRSKLRCSERRMRRLSVSGTLRGIRTFVGKGWASWLRIRSLRWCRGCHLA